jgi:hypothetical protein
VRYPASNEAFRRDHASSKGKDGSNDSGGSLVEAKGSGTQISGR